MLLKIYLEDNSVSSFCAFLGYFLLNNNNEDLWEMFSLIFQDQGSAIESFLSTLFGLEIWQYNIVCNFELNTKFLELRASQNSVPLSKL